MLRFLHTLFAATLLTTALGVNAAGDIGILDRLSGEVSVRSSGGSTLRATAFMKLREGDVLTFAAGSEAQVVYFEAKRRELWKGPASFRLVTDGSVAIAGKAVATSEVKGVPNRETLARAGNVQRLGSLTLRSPRPMPDDATIAKARIDYEKWVATADPDDILPELSMIGLIRERHEPDLLAPYIDALERKQPNRPEVRALVEQYRSPGSKP